MMNQNTAPAPYDLGPLITYAELQDATFRLVRGNEGFDGGDPGTMISESLDDRLIVMNGSYVEEFLQHDATGDQFRRVYTIKSGGNYGYTLAFEFSEQL